MMDLNALPDVVLRTIFNLLTLVDLIYRIPLVCRRWRALQPSVLSSKRTLTLMVGENVDSKLISNLDCDVRLPHTDLWLNEDGTRMYLNYPMECARLNLVGGLTHKDVNRFIETFPTVTYLDLGICSQPVDDTMPLVARLLGHWAPSLRTLKFRCHFDPSLRCASAYVNLPEELKKIQTQVLPQLLPLINRSMPALRRLTLYIRDDLGLKMQLDLPILAQLVEFHFYCHESYEGPHVYLFDSLKRYGESNDQLRAIGVGGITYSGTTYVENMKHFQHSPLAGRFPTLMCYSSSLLTLVMTERYGVWRHVSQIPTYVRTFDGQVIFHLFIRERGVYNLVRDTVSLVRLYRLLHLVIHFELLYHQLEPSQDPIDQPFPLLSVRILTIHITTESHSELASPHWDKIFPNVQVIRLFHSTPCCIECDFKPENHSSEHFADCQQFGDPIGWFEPPKECFEKMLAPFGTHFGATLQRLFYILRTREPYSEYSDTTEKVQQFTVQQLRMFKPSD